MGPSRELEELVALHFEKSDHYRFRKGLVHEEDNEILQFVMKHAVPGDVIVEVGGGSGAFLDLVLNSTSVCDACNVEFVADSCRNQANESVLLVRGTALALPLGNGSCNWIVAKNLLHHLVANSRKQSMCNASLALAEMTRATRQGGHIIIVEQYNRIGMCCTVMLYLTLLLSKIEFRSKYFAWDADVVISFLTPRQLRTLVQVNVGKDVKQFQENNLALPLRFRLSFLMSLVGRAVVIVRRGDTCE